VEKYQYPPVTEGKSGSLMTKTSKNMFKLLISIVNDRRKKIGVNSLADKYYENLANLVKQVKNIRMHVTLTEQ
jgi:non-homologous end joining protein Ku